ncbi:Sal-Like Protein 3 [Manis pentadactyla]|nr:Sal-Like Protein 3 [Manis pentadactyla]
MPRPTGRSGASHPRGLRWPALRPGARQPQLEPEAGKASRSPGRPNAGCSWSLVSPGHRM